jgi:Ca2+-binding EF-hand superfamily protein
MSQKLSSRDPVEDLLATFKLFDSDGSGYITLEKLQRVTKELGETIPLEELQEMIAEADSDNNGRVTAQDFIRVIQRSAK